MDEAPYDWVVRLVEEGITHPKSNDWERQFLRDQAERLEQYHNHIKFSTKQWNVLQKFADKIEFEPCPDPEPC